ncbi:hypothetical protein [Bradyrhizobium jicamae]|nr:hypothetical protein [Bradyrhizobium jicamae]
MTYTVIAWRRAVARASDTSEWVKETLIVILGLAPVALVGAAMLL